MRHVTPATCLVAILMAAASPAQATGIGTITQTVNEAFRTPPGGSEIPAKTDDSLVADEVLRTGDESLLAVRFVDGSELSIEAGSEVVLSDYVFDSQTASSSGVIELNDGLFHFNSNDTADSGIVLQTPIATIGIRGTEFLVTVVQEATIVDIVDGEVEVTPRGGGVVARCVGGQSALVSAEDPNAICGDFGSFSTAAGIPSPAPAVPAGETKDGQDVAQADGPAQPGGPAKGPDKEPPAPADGKSNRSGHKDGSNPGKGGGNGHSKDNGGTDNPGGSD